MGLPTQLSQKRFGYFLTEFSIFPTFGLTIPIFDIVRRAAVLIGLVVHIQVPVDFAKTLIDARVEGLSDGMQILRWVI